ncbi:MAG TPA: hypothetical protein VF796_19880, partial [Humisphaera sp.]
MDTTANPAAPDPATPPSDAPKADATRPDVREVRRRHLGSARSLVVKLGTQLLSDKEGRLDAAFLTSVAAQVATLRQ